jgi:hypothetical protein
MFAHAVAGVVASDDFHGALDLLRKTSFQTECAHKTFACSGDGFSRPSIRHLWVMVYSWPHPRARTRYRTLDRGLRSVKYDKTFRLLVTAPMANGFPCSRGGMLFMANSLFVPGLEFLCWLFVGVKEFSYSQFFPCGVGRCLISFLLAFAFLCRLQPGINFFDVLLPFALVEPTIGFGPPWLA